LFSSTAQNRGLLKIFRKKQAKKFAISKYVGIFAHFRIIMRQLKINKSITNRQNAALDKYLVEIGREELISTDEEVELAQRIHKGDQRALDKLTRANLRFVVSVAKQYQNQGLALNDLIDEGNLGLIKAAQKFDETRGFKFISYAVWWIRQSILQAISEQSRIVRMPLNQVGFQSKLGKAIVNFEQTNERRPSAQELADILDTDEVKVKDALGANGKKVSVDAPFQDDESNSLIDIMTDEDAPATDDNMEKESLSEDLEAALSTLTEREQTVLKMLFGIGCNEMTAEEVAGKLNLTRERVRQIKERALRRLREDANIGILIKYLG
jgi:RNA polymerase primary sigma factor